MTSKRILCVDDEAHILQVVSLKLRNAGYDVTTASDGEEGFELACAHTPDLVIADLQMPYMTGIELCRALRDYAETSDVPVIILTARGYALDESDLEIGNILNVVSKPFSPRAILEMVESALDGRSDSSTPRRHGLPEAA